MGKIKATEDGRLDLLLASSLSISRSKAQQMIEQGVFVEGKKAPKAGFPVKVGQEIEYPELKQAEVSFQGEDIPLNVIYEDDDILIVNKPRGLVVHPAPGHLDGTLANALAFRFNDKEKEEDEEFRMGIVHRIDKDTSGLLAIAKNDKAKENLSKQIASHQAEREYFALAYGIFPDKFFKVDAPIGRNSYDRKKMSIDLQHGKNAVTHFEVLKQYKEAALLKCRLETGRTHQIRVHLAYLGHPVVGDPLYGTKKDREIAEGQVLHAYKLTLVHPTSGQKMSFYGVSDDYFKKCIVSFAIRN